MVVFSARLDESGTDGVSPFTVVGGAVATLAQWQAVETQWDRLLESRKVSAFHYSEFLDRAGDFSGWSDLKAKNFNVSMDRIVKKNTMFRIAIGIEHAVHDEIKQNMKGIKGFRADSNYGLCLRYLLFYACKELSKWDAKPELAVTIENGPWVAGAATVFHRLAARKGLRGSFQYGHMLSDFAVLPKGKTRTLEAADYLAGVAHERAKQRKFVAADNPQISMLLTRTFLMRWYEKMLEEKENRRAYRNARFKKNDD